MNNMTMEQLLARALRIDSERQRKEKPPSKWSKAEQWADRVICTLAEGNRIKGVD